jgi:hypothetical protein
MRFWITGLSLLALAVTAFAYPSNVPNGYAGQPPTGANCVTCHTSYPLNSGNGSLQISGLPAAGYEAGVTYNLIATLADPGQMRWGFELTAIYQSGASYLQAGTFTVTDPTHTALGVGSGTAPDYLKHTSSGTYPGTPGPTSWSFNWTAPNPTIGPIGFYVAGAACNNTGGTSGDYCYTSSSTVNPFGGTPDVFVTLTPIGSIVIPVSGGILNYNIAGGNNGTSPVSVDIWVDVTLPGGSVTDPVLGPLQNFALPGSYSTNRDRTLTVPGSAPAGDYMLNGYMGDYNPPGNVIWAEDHMPFSKSATGMGPWESHWFVDSGEPFEAPPVDAAQPQEYLVAHNYPNPFNPTTAISYQLSANSRVQLRVYDVSGSLVATLVDGWREAGQHEVAFDGSSMASGIYLYNLQAEDYSFSGKMMLMKVRGCPRNVGTASSRSPSGRALF